MKNFDINRFGNVMKWQIVDNGNKLLTFAIIPLAYIIGMNIISVLLNRRPLGLNFVISTGSLLAGLLGLYMVTCGACITGNQKSKNKRMTTMLLPGSRLEKFIARYIVLIIAFPLAAIAGTVVGDLVQMGSSEIMTGNSFSITKGLWTILGGIFHSGLGTNPSPDWEVYLDVVFAFLIVHSVYLYIGTFFRRNSWILSNVAFIVFLILLLTIVAITGYNILNFVYGRGSWSFEYEESTIGNAIEDLIGIAIIVVCYWQSFRRFSRLQAVTRKWINV